MTDCSALPTQEEAELFKQDAGTINEVVTSPDNYTDPASDGLPKKTLAGLAADAAAAIQGVGFTNKGEFSTLPTIENVNEVAVFEGNFWLPTEQLPYTATGSSPLLPPEADKWVVAVTAELLGIARSLNCLNSQVIYSADTITVLDDVLYIYDAGAQVIWGVPSLNGTGETIVSVTGAELQTTGGTYQLQGTRRVVNIDSLDIATSYTGLVSGDVVSLKGYSDGTGGSANWDVVQGQELTQSKFVVNHNSLNLQLVLRFDEVLNIKWIGATGEDDEELYSLLLDAVSYGCKRIYIPNKSWRTWTTLVADGVTFIGDNSVYTGTSIKGAEFVGIKVKNLNRDCNTVSPAQTISGSVSPKLFFRRTDEVAALITRDASNKEYIYHSIAQTSDSAPAQSVGSPFELMRSQQKFRCNACIVYRKDYDTSVGAISLLGNNLDAYFGSGSERLDQDNSSATPMDAWVLGQNDSITYTFQGRKFYDKAYKMSVLAYTTSGSSEAVEIYVNDILVTTYDAVADAQGGSIKRIEFDVPMRTASGNIDVRIVNASTSGARNTYVVGMNMIDLKDLQPESGYDAFMLWYDLTNAYLSTNGANDYAYQDTATGLFAGSYHGGETSTYLRFNIDGDRYDKTSLPILGFKVGKSISVVQRTSINSQFTTYLSTNFDVDGVEVFKAQFKGADVGVNTFYTNLCATGDGFDYVVSPGDFALSATEDTISLNRDVGEVIQYNSSTTQYVRHTFTRFDNSKNSYGGPHLWNRVGTYRKLYYGPVVNNTGNINDFEFEYQREFGFAKY